MLRTLICTHCRILLESLRLIIPSRRYNIPVLSVDRVGSVTILEALGNEFWRRRVEFDDERVDDLRHVDLGGEFAAVVDGGVTLPGVVVDDFGVEEGRLARASGGTVSCVRRPGGCGSLRKKVIQHPLLAKGAPKSTAFHDGGSINVVAVRLRDDNLHVVEVFAGVHLRSTRFGYAILDRLGAIIGCLFLGATGGVVSGVDRLYAMAVAVAHGLRASPSALVEPDGFEAIKRSVIVDRRLRAIAVSMILVAAVAHRLSARIGVIIQVDLYEVLIFIDDSLETLAVLSCVDRLATTNDGFDLDERYQAASSGIFIDDSMGATTPKTTVSLFCVISTDFVRRDLIGISPLAAGFDRPTATS